MHLVISGDTISTKEMNARTQIIQASQLLWHKSKWITACDALLWNCLEADFQTRLPTSLFTLHCVALTLGTLETRRYWTYGTPLGVVPPQSLLLFQLPAFANGKPLPSTGTQVAASPA